MRLVEEEQAEAILEDSTPHWEEQMPLGDDPFSIACRIRICRENLRTYSADLEVMYQNLAQLHPAFGEALAAVRSLPARIAEMEEQLKTQARHQRSPLDLRSQGLLVAFSNPMREVADVQQLLAICPNAEALAPEVFEHTVVVDPKKLNMAIASGALPEAAKAALTSTPTTSNGRVELKYLDK